MRFAIVESGGKQYRAVEGVSLEVDRLPAEPGKKFDFERVLLMADGDEVLVGTPTVSAIQVRAMVVEHFRGPKVISFRYSPKKRIRVKGGHRQDYTRLMVEFIGRAGEDRKPAATERATGERAAKTRGAGAAAKSASKKTAAKTPVKKRPVAKKK
jgi:large subunit ribosomal protein L21